MKKRYTLLLLATVVFAVSGAAVAQNMNPMVGGAAMYRTKDIVDNAVNSADHTTLVAAVKAAGLVPALKGKGPFTVLAPTNDAFAKLPDGTVNDLLKPENKETLTKILTYHVLAGNYDSKSLTKLIKKGRGTAKVKTLSGDTLTLTSGGMKGMMASNQIVIQDEKGNMSNVTITDVRQSNGVIHVIDSVLLPN